MSQQIQYSGQMQSYETLHRLYRTASATYRVAHLCRQCISTASTPCRLSALAAIDHTIRIQVMTSDQLVELIMSVILTYCYHVQHYRQMSLIAVIRKQVQH